MMLNWTAQSALLLGVVFGVGGAVTLAWRPYTPPGARAFVFKMAAVGFIGAAAAALLAGVLYRSTLFYLIAFVYAALVALPLKYGRKSVALCSIVLVGAASALSPRVADPYWLIAPALVAHALGVSVWIGALVPLSYALKYNSRHDRSGLHAFSRFAPFALLPLVATGMLLGLKRLRTGEMSWASAELWLFSAKAILLVPLFGLAAYNRFWLTSALERGAPGAATRLSRSALVEAVLGAIILIIVAGWRAFA